MLWRLPSCLGPTTGLPRPAQAKATAGSMRPSASRGPRGRLWGRPATPVLGECAGAGRWALTLGPGQANRAAVPTSTVGLLGGPPMLCFS